MRKNIHKVGCRASGLLHTVTWGQRAPRPKYVKNVSKYEEIEPRGRSRGGSGLLRRGRMAADRCDDPPRLGKAQN